jgi:hypothetical protein
MEQQTTTEQTTQPKPVVTDQQIIDTLFKEKENYQQTNNSERDAVNEIYTVYMGNTETIETTSNKSYFKSVDIPKMRTEISYIVPFIFSGNPEIEVEGVGGEDKEIAQILEKIINYRFETIPSFYEKIEAWVKQGVTFGTSLIKVIWKFEMQDNGDGTQTPITDEPSLDVPNILDCFYNPIVSDIECQSSIIFRSVLPIDEVKNNPAYDYESQIPNDDGTSKLNRERVISGSLKTNNHDSTRQMTSDAITLNKAGEGMIEVYDRITKDRIQTIADGKERLILRDKAKDTGFIEVVKFVFEPNCIPNRFDGFGVGQNTLGLSKGYHSIFNQTKFNATMCNNPMFYSEKGTIPDKKQLVAKPGGIVEIDLDGQPIQSKFGVIQFPDIKQGAIEILNKFDDEHKRASGANDLVQGSASNKTLGQDQIASTYSSNRFELITRRFKQALADLARMMIDMELKRIQSPEADILRIFPDEVDTGQVDQMGQPVMETGIREQIYQLLISEDAQNAKYNIKIKGETTIAKNKDVQIKQLTDAYNLFGQILPPENQMEWARKILQLRGIDEIDKLVPDPQQFAQEQALQQMEQQPVDPNAMGQGMTPQQPSPMM